MPQSRKSVSSRSASRSASRPQWAERVEHLRRGMKYSQSAMGKKLGFSAMAISRWERGVQEPPSKSYIQLGNMAGDPKCWYFWGRAGLHSGDVIRVLPEAKPERHGFFAPGFDIVTAGSGPLRISSVRTKLVAIPLLKVHAGAHGHKGDKSQNLHDLPATDAIAAPSAWCPHPSKTTCLRVRGDSMMPLIHDDYVLAVDTFEADPDKLNDKVIVAWHKSKGLTVSRLQRIDHTNLLVSENPRYESISIGRDSGWHVVGKVLWWIGKAD
jgi:SOS-response transcriptional repressor LexA/DNA-binding XRE family transcriptional regulator